MRYVKHSEKSLKWDELYEKMPLYLTLYAYFECLNIPNENNGEQECNTVNIRNQVLVNHGLSVVNHLEYKISP